MLDAEGETHVVAVALRHDEADTVGDSDTVGEPVDEGDFDSDGVPVVQTLTVTLGDVERDVDTVSVTLEHAVAVAEVVREPEVDWERLPVPVVQREGVVVTETEPL